jgi:uncharacterized membrane protein YgdD (TMEM256/DUF423 family)
MSQITTRAVIVPAEPPLPTPAEVALAAYRAGVLDARSAHPAPATVLHYAPTYIVHTAHPAPARPLAPAFTRPDRRRYSLAEVVFIAGRVLIAGGVLDLALCLLTGDVTYLLGLAPIGGVALTLGGAIGINREESA